MNIHFCFTPRVQTFHDDFFCGDFVGGFVHLNRFDCPKKSINKNAGWCH